MQSFQTAMPDGAANEIVQIYTSYKLFYLCMMHSRVKLNYKLNLDA